MLPGRENFKLEARTYDVTEELPAVVHRLDIWYVLSEITPSSHVGTHVEFPYHHQQEEGRMRQIIPHAYLKLRCGRDDFLEAVRSKEDYLP